MDLFPVSPRSRQLREDLLAFMADCVYPAEPSYDQQLAAAGDPHHHPAILEDLKQQARERGLWNLFHPDPQWGAGLSNLDYAPLAEIMGRSPFLAPEACNCNAPDTGNMELLSSFGTPEQQQRWLRPLLDGTIRSAFAMTEPAVASSDATNIALSMRREGEHYRLDGRKWFVSNAFHAHCRVLIVMGKTDPQAPTHRQQSMMVIPIDSPGITLVRDLPTFGYHDRVGHGEIVFDGVRVPVSDILGGEGEGFAMGQARLGPGRIHHCLRAIGMAERALDLLCRRAQSRTTFGAKLSERANIQDWIAESRMAIDAARLLTVQAAWLMDTAGAKAAHAHIAASKVAAPAAALQVLDRAIQVHGAAGVTEDVPLARMWAHVRTLRLADGPDEVHKRSIARAELRRTGSIDDRL